MILQGYYKNPSAGGGVLLLRSQYYSGKGDSHSENQKKTNEHSRGVSGRWKAVFEQALREARINPIIIAYPEMFCISWKEATVADGLHGAPKRYGFPPGGLQGMPPKKNHANCPPIPTTSKNRLM